MIAIDQLLIDLISDDIHQRTEAARQLATFRDDRIVPALCEALIERPIKPKHLTRWTTLHNVINREQHENDERNFQELVQTCRQAIADSLVAQGDIRAVKPLEQFLKMSPAQNSERIIQAIGTFKSDDAWNVLCNALAADFIVEQAAIALYKQDKIRAIEPLIQAFEMPQYQNPAQGDYFSTQRIIARTQQSLINLLVDIGQPAVTNLINALQHKHWMVRDGVAKTLARIGDKRAVEPL